MNSEFGIRNFVGGNLPPVCLPPLTGEAASGVPFARKPDDGGVSEMARASVRRRKGTCPSRTRDRQQFQHKGTANS